MSNSERPVEVYTQTSMLGKGESVTVRVGNEVATLSAEEWSYLISHPTRSYGPPVTVK
jgi:hypothetical protein